MARRNIFDRDTGAGYYSDALGNFLESIPSLYGQLSREKRLEKQRIEDTNYRNQTYNNQLLQQSRNNIRQKKLDDLNERKFTQKVKNDEFTQAYQIAKAHYDVTGDYSRLAQVEKQYSPETYNPEKVNKIKAGTNDRQIFDDNYLDWDSLSLDEKYGKGNELQDLISESSRLMKTGDARNKINYQNINKLLRNEFKTYTKNSGQLIKDKDLWSGQKGQFFLKSYESNERDIKSYEKQITDLQSRINEIIPQSLSRVKNPTTPKEAGYNDRQIQELSILNNRLKNLEIKKVKLMDKNLEITDGFKYPIFNIDPTGEDYALEGMKPEKPVEQETNITDNNQEKLEKMDADILSSIGDLDDAKIDEFMSVLDSDNPEDLDNYLFGFEEGETDLVEGETSPKPIQTDLVEGEVTTEPITEPTSIPTVIPTLTANQEAIEGINKVDPAKILDNIFGKEGEIKSARENLLKEMDKAEAAKYNIEPLKDASRKDNKVVAQERRKVASYITKELEGDLAKLNRLKIKIKDFIGKDDQTSKFNLRKDSKTIKEIENRIKNTIGKYINPISGDISIADKNYKDSVIKRLNKKFGKDLYPLLASFSSVQRIN